MEDGMLMSVLTAYVHVMQIFVLGWLGLGAVVGVWAIIRDERRFRDLPERGGNDLRPDPWDYDPRDEPPPKR